MTSSAPRAEIDVPAAAARIAPYLRRTPVLRGELGGRQVVFKLEHLAALSLATHQLRDLRRPGTVTAEERLRKAGEVLTESGAYQLRYQMLITAPEVLEEPTERAFAAIRGLRDRFDEPDVSTEPRWNDAVAVVTDAIVTLRRAMRTDLAKSG